MDFNSSYMSFRGKRKIIAILILLVIGVITVRVVQNIPAAKILRESAKDPSFYSFTPLENTSLFLKWEQVPIVTSNETTLDLEILKYINDHNAMRNKIKKITIYADSFWMGFSNNDIWRLQLEWDRVARTVSVESRGQRCVLKDIGAFHYSETYQGSIHTNLVHYVILMTWNPSLFESASIKNDTLVRQMPSDNGLASPIDVKVLLFEDKGISFYFDKHTGSIVRIEGPLLDYGPAQVDMYNFVVIDESKNIVLPTLVRVRVPDSLFNVALPLQFDRIIQLQFDANDVRLEYF